MARGEWDVRMPLVVIALHPRVIETSAVVETPVDHVEFAQVGRRKRPENYEAEGEKDGCAKKRETISPVHESLVLYNARDSIAGD